MPLSAVWGAVENIGSSLWGADDEIEEYQRDIDRYEREIEQQREQHRELMETIADQADQQQETGFDMQHMVLIGGGLLVAMFVIMQL